MTLAKTEATVDQRRASTVHAKPLGRQSARDGWWRGAAVCALLVLALGTTMVYRRLSSGPLDKTSLTLHGSRGAAVTLSLRPQEDLEARFSESADEALRSAHIPAKCLRERCDHGDGE